MARPATWILQRSRPVLDVGTGWTVVESYAGPASETELAAIETWFPGASKIELDKDPHTVVGDVTTYWVECSVTYPATGPDGARLPSSDPDYGLYSRSWELDFEREQVPLVQGNRATELTDYDSSWVSRIDLLAQRYRKQMADYLKGQTGDATNVEEPQVSEYIPLVSTGTSTLNPVALWLWNKLRTDPDATEIVEVPTLRKTEVVAAFANVHASHLNCGRVYRYTKLITVETTMEAAVLLQLSEVKTQFPYWLKRRPQVELSSQGRFTITQEYSGIADYDRIQYGAPL